MKDELMQQTEHLEPTNEQKPDFSEGSLDLPSFSDATRFDQTLTGDVQAFNEYTQETILTLDLPDVDRKALEVPTEEIASQMEATLVDAREETAFILDQEAINTLPESNIIDIEHPDTSPEIKQLAADAGIKLMHSVLEGIDDYVVFASTALYLHGRENNITKLQVPPGDFDAAVQKEETLKKIQERLNNVPGISFANSGKWKKLAGGADVLEGKIVMDIQTSVGLKKIGYPFEFFRGTMMATKEITLHQERLGGLNILTLEGLQSQYLNNLQFESRVGTNTGEVAKFLLKPEIEKQMRMVQDGQSNPITQSILRKLQLTPADINQFYAMRDELFSSVSQSGDVLEERLSDLAILLSGFKTKIPKRKKNVEQIKNIRSL